MIDLRSSWAVVMRHIRLWQRDYNALLANLYWPFLDILIWGFLGTWLARIDSAALPNYKIAALLGILLWQVVGRGCNIITNMLCEEFWSGNLINLFALPLSIGSWIVGVLLFYSIGQCVTSTLCMIGIFILYTVPILQMIAYFFLFLPPLILSAIWLSFTCLQILVLGGRRSIEVSYILGWFFLPFSGAYYPVAVLPAWGKAISAFLPMSYVFEGMRNYVMYQHDPTVLLMKGYALGLLYALCAIAGFIYCFNRSKHKGLARLSQ